jgi:hypothetical protein
VVILIWKPDLRGRISKFPFLSPVLVLTERRMDMRNSSPALMLGADSIPARYTLHFKKIREA